MDSSPTSVFLSFRREDTGRTFVSHLRRSLDKKGIRTYKDENQVGGDGRTFPEVTKVIRESEAAVVVISENYASSVRCLEVLASITERLRFRFSMTTVFYKVDPGDLTRPTGKFADDLRRHEEWEYPETVNRWRSALETLESADRTYCSQNWEDDSKMLDELIISISTPRFPPTPPICLPPIPPPLPTFGPIPPRRHFFRKGSTGINRRESSGLRLERPPILLPPTPPPSPPLPTFRPTPPRRQFFRRVSTGINRRESSSLRLESDSYSKILLRSLSGSQETGPDSDADHQDTSLPDNMPNTESPSPASEDSSGLVGMFRHKKAVYGLLDLESKNSVRTVGIWGAEGVGKTTLAECVFDEISPDFQHHCFLTNVNNIYHTRASRSLLKHFTRTRSPSDIFAAIKPSLVNRNVLLVLDGIDSESEQFKDAMKVTRWLGPGSRVIMTSDDQKSLASWGVKHLYQLECPSYEDALKLFSTFAFKKTYPLLGFEGFSIRAIHFAGRLPLALKALGSFLYDKDKETWKTTLHKLESSQDNGSRMVTGYIGGCEYIPRSQTELEHYVRGDDEEEEHLSSYHMLL